MIDPQNPTPEVKKWITRLRRTIRAAPSGVWLFNNGEMNVMASGPDGRQVRKSNYAVDGDYVIDTISDILSEGGDF